LLKRPQVKNSKSVEYAAESELSAKEFRAILIASGLAERRPASDATRQDQMLRQADIIVTARVGNAPDRSFASNNGFFVLLFFFRIWESMRHINARESVNVSLRKRDGQQALAPI
jgi:hypothetical protein